MPKEDVTDKKAEHPIEFPLRGKNDRSNFRKYLFICPIMITILVAAVCGGLLFGKFSWVHFLSISLIHGVILFVFLWLLWVPSWLALTNWSERWENISYYSRTILLLLIAMFFFPHSISEYFFKNIFPEAAYTISWVMVGIAVGIYFIFAVASLKKTALRDIQAGREPRQRKYSEKWLTFNAITITLILFNVFIIELWFMAAFSTPEFTLNPHQNIIQAAIRDNNLQTIIPWITSSIFASLIFFFWACLGNQLMKEILVPATFHERDVEGLIFKAPTYLREFIAAILLKHPFLIVGGIILTAIILVTPLFLVATQHTKFFENIIGADQLIWTIGIFIAWFGPIISAVIHPDETFGEYFNQRLANLMMMVQGHVVVIGFGSLGKRVVDREIKVFDQKEERDRGIKEFLSRKRRKYYLTVVTPDVRLERICTHLVVIEREPTDLVYSAENNLLGYYGVVAADIQMYKSRDLRGKMIHAEKRVLVPMIIGEAREPFISSRVNLERAVQVISTVPDGDSVQNIFDRASRSGINSIICVSRSDQISYLTYRARHRPIVLVYPKHNQGITLGYRLWAAILKVRSVEPELKEDKTLWPKILIVGNSKAYRFMIETLWAFLPGDHEEKVKHVREHFKFIVTSPQESPGHPELKEKPFKKPFDMYWPDTFIASGRFPYPVEPSLPSQIELFSSGAASELPQLNLEVHQINEADSKIISECIYDFKPRILLINHDDFQRSSLMLLRCVRSLERLKMRDIKNFRLPLILLSASQGDRRERYVMGDASRYYDALCRMHGEPLAMDHGYPSHSWFDHFMQESVGETISDSLADAEEIIAGARRSFSSREELPDQVKKNEKSKQFIEITSCLPNISGALAEYLAQLAGLKFKALEWEAFISRWNEVKNHIPGFPPAEKPCLPSFQYLRHIKLGDPDYKGFALTGYAALTPVTSKTPLFDSEFQKISKVARIYANDGRHYVEKELDPDEMDEMYGRQVSKTIRGDMKKMEEPQPPGVPNVIDLLTNREAGRKNTIQEYRQTILDAQPGEPAGDHACPGMNLCRIAAFQDFVSASNNLRLSAKDHSDINLKKNLYHVRNYYCCTDAQKIVEKNALPGLNSAYARIFCCANEIHQPGMIARVLNALLFRLDYETVPGTSAIDNWVINIDYLNDITCQNAHFSLNRLFGVFADKNDKQYEKKLKNSPFQLLRILPIGGIESAKQWYVYAKVLFRFLQSAGFPNLKFYWLDENREKRTVEDYGAKSKPDKNTTKPQEKEPEFKNGSSYPIMIVIKQERGDSTDPNKCRICGLQDREYDCHKFRAWV